MWRLFGPVGRERHPITPADHEEALAAQVRAAADDARDAGDWPNAAARYSEYLALRPMDAAILVQRGHALKECGQLDEAEASYVGAQRLQPGDPDLHLQLGHLHKLQGRVDDAERAYARAGELGLAAEAERELAGLRRVTWLTRSRRRTAVALPVDALLLEIGDLLAYLGAHSTLSGMQRVQVAAISHVLGLPPAAAARYAFVLSYEDELFVLPNDALAGLLACLDRADAAAQSLPAAVDAVVAGTAPTTLQPGQAVLILGAFWGGPGGTRRWRSAVDRGARLGVLLHDLIPLTHPELCEPGVAREFGSALRAIAPTLGFALAVSEYTAQAFRSFLAREGMPAIPIEATPNAHAGRGLLDGPDAWTSSIEAWRDGQFVLSVSTLEARKNQAYLLHAWCELGRMGVVLPHLAIVGRQGWLAADLLAQIGLAQENGVPIRVLHGLSDPELGTLYRNCLFSILPSFVEGWGIPIGEGLACGRPCIAAAAAAMPEVGGDLADYVDPLDLRGGIAVIRRMIEDAAYRESRAADVRTRFRPRTWGDAAAAMLEAARRLAHLDAVPG